MERKAPLHTSSTAIKAAGVSGVRKAQRENVTADAREANTSTALKPNLRVKGVVAGLIPMLPMNTAATKAPACSGDQPKPAWNISGSRNGTELMVTRWTKPPV